MFSLRRFHKRHERLWFFILAMLGLIAALVFAQSVQGLL